MLDAAELAGTAGMPVDEAIKKATSNFDKAKMMSGGSDEEFVKIRIKQVQNLEKKYPKLRVKKAKTAESSTSNALNYKLNDVRDAMMDKNRFPNFVGVKDLIEAVSPTTFKNIDNLPIFQGVHERAHFRRRKDLGYMTSCYMGLAAVLPPGINNIMSRLEGIGLSRDVLNLNAADARENFELALKRTGMDKFATVDDLYAAVQDDGKFKTKSEYESGRVVRATKEQKNSLRMFLEAAAKRQRWLPTRPPRLVMGGYNLGGMIPGGSISRGRSNYGNIAPALRLLAPDKDDALTISPSGRRIFAAAVTYVPDSITQLFPSEIPRPEFAPKRHFSPMEIISFPPPLSVPIIEAPPPTSVPSPTTTPAEILPSTIEVPSVPALKLTKPSCITVVPDARCAPRRTRSASAIRTPEGIT
jgi:hypothetical protein